jgi:hypothetical protein
VVPVPKRLHEVEVVTMAPDKTKKVKNNTNPPITVTMHTSQAQAASGANSHANNSDMMGDVNNSR